MSETFTAQDIKQAIAFYYLLAYCPAGKLEDFKRATGKLHPPQNLGILGEVCTRIVTFQSALRHPEEEIIIKLLEVLPSAAESAEGLKAYQTMMAEISSLPGRAKADNRLHRKKGCRFCEAPCVYGFFSLVSEPRFDLLQQLLEAEKEKAPEEKSAVRAVWSYTIAHIIRLTGSQEGFITPKHLGNLAYCLLMLSMAKSRYPLPEKQVKIFQARNQQFIANWKK
jgi:hypothetical protein